MALTVKMILTHVTGASDVLLLADGKKFVIVDGARRSHLVTETDAAALVKELTGIKTAIKIAKLKVGRVLAPIDKVISLLSADAVIEDEPNYQILTTVLDTAPINVWPLTITNETEIITLPHGVLDDVIAYLLSQGVEKAPTAGTYDKIEFVDKLPATVDEDENPIAIPAGTVFVLNKKDGDKAVDSAWKFADNAWTEVTDDASTDNVTVVDGGGEDASGFQPGPAFPTP